MVSCLQFCITNLVLSKYQKLVKTAVKLKEKLNPTHRYRKVPFSGVHTNALPYRFQKNPLWKVFSNRRVFSHRFNRIHVNISDIRKKKVVFENENAYVWTGSQHSHIQLWAIRDMFSLVSSLYIKLTAVTISLALHAVYFEERKKQPENCHRG